VDMSEKHESDSDIEDDPLEFVRAVLAISPEDAAEVRRDAAAKGVKPDKGAEHGDDDS
jgi:hypothetical protein